MYLGLALRHKALQSLKRLAELEATLQSAEFQI